MSSAEASSSGEHLAASSASSSASALASAEHAPHVGGSAGETSRRTKKTQLEEACQFAVRLHMVKVVGLTQRHKFGADLRAVFHFQQDATGHADSASASSSDSPATPSKSKKSGGGGGKGGKKRGKAAAGHVVKTEYSPSRGGDVNWVARKELTLQTPFKQVAQVADWLKAHHVTALVYSKGDAKAKKRFGNGKTGELKVDLFTCATGPARHNLPLTNKKGKVVGRLEFLLEMQQVTTVKCTLSEMAARDLCAANKSTSSPVGKRRLTTAGGTVKDKKDDVNAYLKYGYSLKWPSGHVYSRCRERTASPKWITADCPPLKFRTTLDQLMNQAVFIHVTDAHDDILRGERHTPLGEMRFDFAPAIRAKGLEPIDTGGIRFRSQLASKTGAPLGSFLEGVFAFRNVPKFAQMKAVNVQRAPIHTEKGIIDAIPLFPWLVQPELPCFVAGGAKPLTLDAEAAALRKAAAESLAAYQAADPANAAAAASAAAGDLAQPASPAVARIRRQEASEPGGGGRRRRQTVSFDAPPKLDDGLFATPDQLAAMSAADASAQAVSAPAPAAASPAATAAPSPPAVAPPMADDLISFDPIPAAAPAAARRTPTASSQIVPDIAEPSEATATASKAKLGSVKSGLSQHLGKSLSAFGQMDEATLEQIAAKAEAALAAKKKAAAAGGADAGSAGAGADSLAPPAATTATTTKAAPTRVLSRAGVAITPFEVNFEDAFNLDTFDPNPAPPPSAPSATTTAADPASFNPFL